MADTATQREIQFRELESENKMLKQALQIVILGSGGVVNVPADKVKRYFDSWPHVQIMQQACPSRGLTLALQPCNCDRVH